MYEKRTAVERGVRICYTRCIPDELFMKKARFVEENQFQPVWRQSMRGDCSFPVALAAGIFAMPALGYVAIISIRIGLTFLALFIVFLMIELHQDKRLDRYDQQHRDRKVPLGNGRYECQTCGNKNFSKRDEYCSLCSTRFQNTQ